MDSKSIRGRESKLSLHKKAFVIIKRIYKRELFLQEKLSETECKAISGMLLTSCFRTGPG